jgi:hypothetical protein
MKRLTVRGVAALVLLAFMTTAAFAAEPAKADGVLWTDPGDVRSKDLFYGPGGKDGQPQPPVTFLNQDAEGTSPKFEVRDQAHKKWKAKLGVEARPETAASRLLWAVGYFANDNYFLPKLEVQGLPPRLARGQEFVGPSGTVNAARLQKHPDEYKRTGDWSWHHNPFKGTREFNGLRVMMALLSNWDLKDENNAILESADEAKGKLYEVSDVGASFGRSGESYTSNGSKGVLGPYQRSKFVSKVTPEYVDFNFPTHLPFIYVFNFPLFFGELSNHWVGRHIPRADVKWIGSLLGQLTAEQIRDAFRAADYPPETLEGYAQAVEKRIAELQKL